MGLADLGATLRIKFWLNPHAVSIGKLHLHEMEK